MSEAGDFIDSALQYEVSPYAYPSDTSDGLTRYGTSIGAIRGTVRDAFRRYPRMSRDELLALCSELWVVPVFERRLAAVVMMQTRVDELIVTDLTRIEGFLRTASADAIADPLTTDVVLPLVRRMNATDAADAAKARVVLRRWASEPSAALKAAAARATGAE
jgi:DNA alkylation repair enzyme